MTAEKAMQFLEENLKTIFAYSLSRVSNKNDAEDLTNDIVVAVIESAHRLKNDEAFFGFVWQIAANTYKKFLQKKKKQPIMLSDNITQDENICNDICDNEDIITLRREIALLNKQYRECTVDYYYLHLSVREIAEKRKITPEMIKYYLFKTRKILKEGIAMERQFGEKSFNPAPFELKMIFNGDDNDMFENFFEKRKLPGQIMLAAYYTPMSINELSVELGMPTIYLEDELEILQKMNFIKKVGKDKYQTNILIFNDDFFSDTWNFAKSKLSADVKSAVGGLKSKLSAVRDIGFVGNNISDDLLIWDLITICVWNAYNNLPTAEYEKLYDNTSGVCYGLSCSGKSNMYHFARCLAGRTSDKNKSATLTVIEAFFHANGRKFDIHKDIALYYEKFPDLIDEALSNPDNAKIAVFTNDELDKVKEIITDEREEIRQIMDRYNKKCTEIMLSRAPKGVSVTPEQMLNIILSNIIGVISDLAIEAKSVGVPPLEQYPALFGYAD